MLGVAFICVLFVLPTTEAAIPWSSDFDRKTLNYAPIAVSVVTVPVGSRSLSSARRWFTGPTRPVDEVFEEVA